MDFAHVTMLWGREADYQGIQEMGLDYSGPEKSLRRYKDNAMSECFTEGDILIHPQKPVLKLSK